MNAQATSLDKLHDIVVLAPVPWWPPAPGWYWVIAFALLVLTAMLLRCFVRWQGNRYRREALAILAGQQTALSQPESRAAALLVLSDLLKRTALSTYPREQVATLTGPKWFDFLDRTGRGTRFRDGVGALLQDAVYDPRIAAKLPETKLHDLTNQIRRWIKTHSAANAHTVAEVSSFSE